MLTSETLRLKNGRSWHVSSGGSGAPLLWLHGLSGLHKSDPLVAACADAGRPLPAGALLF